MNTYPLNTTALVAAMFWLMAVLSSCTKDDIVVINDNMAPPDSTISEVTYESYVNRSYIALTGRKPSDQEETSALSLLHAGGLDLDSRKTMLEGIVATDAYRVNLYIESGDLLLNGYDTTILNTYINVLNQALNDTSLMFLWSDIQYELVRLQDLKDVPYDLYNGTIDRAEMQRRMVDNYAYDQINMGTENFVLSIFDLILLRQPTTAELLEGKNMVDGFEGTLFLKIGNSKSDLLDIFFASQEYYASQVTAAYQKYLFRDPTVEELSEYTTLYNTTGSYEDVLVEILATDEYVRL